MYCQTMSSVVLGSAGEGSPPRTRAGGDEHSSHSDEELIDIINDPYFKPVLFTSPPSPLPFRTQDELPRFPSALTPSPFFATPEFQKPRLLVNSLGHRTTAPTKAQLRAAAARERWEQHAEQ